MVFKVGSHHAHHPNRIQLGAAERAACKQQGLTQPQLALAAGVSTRFIVNLESGKPMGRLEHVLHAIGALGG